MGEYTKAVQDYIALEREVLSKLDVDAIDAALTLLADCMENERNIYVFGNGGSSATASHFQNDFNKGVSEHTEKKFRFTCLNDNVPVPESIKEINWHKLLEFATAQTIQGVFARTILMQDGKLGKDDFMGNKPTDDDVMDWVFEAHRLRKENEILFKRANKASEWFLENGFQNCILKGQGNALMYPDPYARVPGDIDIWLDGGREKILEFTTKYYQRKPTSIHVDFPMFADAGVEVHFRPSYMLNPFIDKKLVRYFDEIKASQFGKPKNATNRGSGLPICRNFKYQIRIPLNI